MISIKELKNKLVSKIESNPELKLFFNLKDFEIKTHIDDCEVGIGLNFFKKDEIIIVDYSFFIISREINLIYKKLGLEQTPLILLNYKRFIELLSNNINYNEKEDGILVKINSDKEIELIYNSLTSLWHIWSEYLTNNFKLCDYAKIKHRDKINTVIRLSTHDLFLLKYICANKDIESILLEYKNNMTNASIEGIDHANLLINYVTQESGLDSNNYLLKKQKWVFRLFKKN